MGDSDRGRHSGHYGSDAKPRCPESWRSGSALPLPPQACTQKTSLLSADGLLYPSTSKVLLELCRGGVQHHMKLCLGSGRLLILVFRDLIFLSFSFSFPQGQDLVSKQKVQIQETPEAELHGARRGLLPFSPLSSPALPLGSPQSRQPAHSL